MKYVILALMLSACAAPKGDLGATGANGSAVTVVNFCPPAGPTLFPSTGLCINNQVYGIYTASSSFLALLSPGAYGSSQGATCSFTILPNCGIVFQ